MAFSLNNIEIASTAGLKRRLMCFTYEALLVFGVLSSAVAFNYLCAALFSSDALKSRHVLQIWLFLVLGGYFVFFWCKGGQTLAMKTWHIQLISPGSESLPLGKAIARYLLAWMWFLPAMILSSALSLKIWATFGIFLLGITLWAMTAMFNKDRQFLHDSLVGTRLIRIKKKT